MPQPNPPKIRPFQPAPPNRFCRLFKPHNQPFDGETMKALGLTMKGAPRPSAIVTVAAVYTYLGQFIDHDITRDDTFLFDAGKTEPNKTENKGGGRLDLHHVYGKGPNSKTHGYLYEQDRASFKLGEVTNNGQTFDLPLYEGKPASADNRNVENLIQRQICVLFMKLHNKAVAELRKTGLSGRACFLQAKEKVTHQYQWMVIKDFLFHVLHPKEFRRLWKTKTRSIDWGSKFSVPVEFSQAAFRFGHSMIRPRYQILKGLHGPTGVNLQTIFAGKRKSTALRPTQAISWNAFVAGKSLSMAIDTRISPALFKLPKLPRIPKGHGQPGRVGSLPEELPVRTLRRGALTGLPTGEEVAKAFGLQPVAVPDQAARKKAPWKALNTLGLLGRTPLWYYILLEAELQLPQLSCLGKVGSRIVGEVIDACLAADPKSFYYQPGKRRPTWKTDNGQPFSIGNLAELARFVGL